MHSNRGFLRIEDNAGHRRKPHYRVYLTRAHKYRTDEKATTQRLLARPDPVVHSPSTASDPIELDPVLEAVETRRIESIAHNRTIGGQRPAAEAVAAEW